MVVVPVCTGTLTHRQAKQTGTPGPTSARCHILTTPPLADHLVSQDTLPGRMGSRSRYTTTQSQAPRLGASILCSILLGTTIRCNGASTLLVATTTLILTTWTMDMVSQRFLGGSSFWSRYTTKQGSRMGPPPADHLVSHHRTGSQGGRTGSRKGASTLLAITHCNAM